MHFIAYVGSVRLCFSRSAALQRYDPLNVPPASIHEQANGEPEGKRAKSDGPKLFPANKALAELLSLVKSETMEMIEMINSVKIWVQLNIPRIEDGTIFGRYLCR